LPAVEAKQPPPGGGEAASHAPAAVGQSPEHATTGAPVASSAETPGALAPASPSAPAAVNPLPPPLPPPQPEPTLQFRAFVDHLKINGVRTGPPPRLFVEGISCRPGDVLDHDLGVIFDGLDSTSNEIIFKDATGAVVRRRF
jgi:3-oxoacyl-ACP reductase-like protein